VCPPGEPGRHLEDLVYHLLTADSAGLHFGRCSEPLLVQVVAGTSTVVEVLRMDCEAVEGGGDGVHDGDGAGVRVDAREVSGVANSVVVVVVVRRGKGWSVVRLPGPEEGSWKVGRDSGIW
jgi:hypothetical protein